MQNVTYLCIEIVFFMLTCLLCSVSPNWTNPMTLVHLLNVRWRLSLSENAVAEPFLSLFQIKIEDDNNASTRSPLSSLLLSPNLPIDWLIDWSANQDASTTFYPEARWGTRLCSIHTDATMLPPSLPPSPPPLSAHLPITHSPPCSTPTQAWALDRITSVSTNPSVSRHYIHYWQSQWGGIVRAYCFFVLVYFLLKPHVGTRHFN